MKSARIVTLAPHGGEYTGDYNELIYLRARFYTPTLGIFTSKDIRSGDPYLPMSYNRWSYVNGNPINYVDPTGHGPIHFQVLIRYAALHNLIPEYTIPSTIPNAPPLWPGQRRGKRVDLADVFNFQIWEVEPYSPSGNYPSGHGLKQVENYLDLLNITTNKWMPGRYLERQSFTVGAYDVRAWWEAPGLIVYQTKINKERALVTSAMLCYFTYTSTIEELQKRLRELPNSANHGFDL